MGSHWCFDARQVGNTFFGEGREGEKSKFGNNKYRNSMLIYGGTTLYILGGLLLQRDFEQTSEINLLDLSNFSWSSSLKLRNFSEILSDEILRRYGHSITTTGKGSFVCVGGSGNHSKSYKSLLNDVIFLKQWEPLDL
eukprot:TRINITY_DN7538_c0_g1_i4.p2 TRINITY_DN7538_c0_g1~~TRINITY_DN7538_c0_g1_i4.p2  ORF type:complete len:138 (-),score=26.24 TRINITY_DN7538_c0_g1_i4:91-504(-)